MPTIAVPDYAGGSILNLVADLEQRLGGTPLHPPLRPELSRHVPDATTYVLVIFDGLGDVQLAHRAARRLAEVRTASLDAPFPATTTVSLATIVTGMPPSGHGLLGYQLWLPELAQVANTIKWTTLWGEALDYPTDAFLPSPNLWERLSPVGVEPITVQPAGFAATPLTRALYRGCRFEGIATVAEWVDAVSQLAAVPRRLILAYLPQVDFAAHVHGQRSSEYDAAVRVVAGAWEDMARRLPAGAVAVGTADHGHVDFARQIKIPRSDHEGRVFYGDGRAMFVRGDGAPLAAALPATWLSRRQVEDWWGPGPRHEAFSTRAPDGVLLADDDVMLLHRFSDDRMIGNHGAMTEAERRVPLLVAAP